MFLTPPTILTWTRIIAIPIIMGVYFLPIPVATQNLVSALLFIIFAITDWLDGYLARKLNMATAFGAFLDPVADKFLVCASMLILVYLRRADVFAALIIIGREVAISALREWMAQIGALRSVAVHMIGKLKTAVQMTAIALLLYDHSIGSIFHTRLLGFWLLWLAVALTVWSMGYYLHKALPEIRAKARQDNLPNTH